MVNCENQKKNAKDCTCTYSCAKRGLCCECVTYHRSMNQIPGCFFSKKGEKTYDRSVESFVKAYNAQTANKKGEIIPVVITVYEDRTFSFITKLPPVSAMIKKELNLEKGSGTAGKETVGSLTKAQVEKIAQAKMEDLNCDNNLNAAKQIVIGTAKSMGVKVGG